MAAASTADTRLDLATRIETAALQTKPSDHIYLRDLFTPAYYAKLLAMLPATRRYRELRHRQAIRAADGRSARRKFHLFPEHITLLPAPQRAFWRELSRQLRSSDLQAAFKRRFQGALERRFGKSIDALRIYRVPMLLRDLGGYGSASMATR